MNNRKDILLGGLRRERTCFDVLRYDIDVKINPEEKSIVGYNDITFKILEKTNTIQIDLFENMKVEKILFNSHELEYQREFGALFIKFQDYLEIKSINTMRIYYSGQPVVAKQAPWDGGLVFKKDSNNKDWIGLAVQGLGSSSWLATKDSQSDEPDNGISIKVAVPNGLMNVSNGRFLGSVDLHNGYTRWDWEVKNPINNYNITINIGDYVHFYDKYKELDLDYYVLKENLEKAKVHFKQVKKMMACYEKKIGSYPFIEDGYKLVDTPYLGMENQSAVAYGNGYSMGYLAKDLSKTGIGLLFDFIIIHESAHEWFGNSITSKDIADMWIHESFTTYMESVYVECEFGKIKAKEYINGLKGRVKNDKAIIGIYGQNKSGSADMYFKGALFLNTLRHIINNDKLWWKILYEFAQKFRHKIIETEDVIEFFNRKSKINLRSIFDQYLRYRSIPGLELRINEGKLQIRWISDVIKLEMPVEISIKNKVLRFWPKNYWTDTNEFIKDASDIKILKENFYIDSSFTQ